MTLMKKALIATALAGMVVISASPASFADEKEALTPAQKAQVQKLIRETLLKNPEIIVEAVQELRRRQEAAKQAALQSTLKAKRDELLSDAADPVVGNPKGDITIVEFFDYNCGYCRRVKSAVDSVVSKDGNIRLVYKEFPILGPGSEVASRAALAAKRQGKYEKFHNAMFAFRGRLGATQVMSIAKAVGLDMDKLKADMKDPAIMAQIKKNHALAKQLGITGTPAFVIGNELVPGAVPAAELRKHVADARQVCKKTDRKVC
jgi:protein-disulfide isomerase